MANFAGRLTPHVGEPGALDDPKLATSPLVLTTSALRACDADRPLTSVRAAPYCLSGGIRQNVSNENYAGAKRLGETP